MAFWVPHKLRWQARLRREWGDRCRREARGFSAELGTTILEGPLPPREVRRRTCGSDRTRSTPYRVGRDAAKTPPALTGDTPYRLRCCERAFAAVSGPPRPVTDKGTGFWDSGQCEKNDAKKVRKKTVRNKKRCSLGNGAAAPRRAVRNVTSWCERFIGIAQLIPALPN